MRRTALTREFRQNDIDPTSTDGRTDEVVAVRRQDTFTSEAFCSCRICDQGHVEKEDVRGIERLFACK